MDKLTVRAITAFYRSLDAGQVEAPMQAHYSELDGRGYVVLKERLSGQLRAVYRCMNRGELKRLKRWPIELPGVEPPLHAAPALSEPLSPAESLAPAQRLPSAEPLPSADPLPSAESAAPATWAVPAAPATPQLLELVPLPRKGSDLPTEPNPDQADLF